MRPLRRWAHAVLAELRAAGDSGGPPPAIGGLPFSPAQLREDSATAPAEPVAPRHR